MLYLTIVSTVFNPAPFDATDVFINIFFAVICLPILLADILFSPIELLSLLIFRIYEKKGK